MCYLDVVSIVLLHIPHALVSSLLMQAETLRDSFAATDKSLSRLLGEAPYLPKSVLQLLESLCSPGNSDRGDKELPSGDRVTQGLSAVWNLILHRPPLRDGCLKIALQVCSNFYEPCDNCNDVC